MGRAFTRRLMPLRPDVSEVDQADRRGTNQLRRSHQTAADMWQKGHVPIINAAERRSSMPLQARHSAGGGTARRMTSSRTQGRSSAERSCILPIG